MYFDYLQLTLEYQARHSKFVYMRREESRGRGDGKGKGRGNRREGVDD